MGRGKHCFKIRDLLAEERRNRSILGFLRTMEVERRVGPKGSPTGPEERCRSEAAELEGESGRGQGEGHVGGGAFSLGRFSFLRSLRLWVPFLSFSSVRDRPGGGRGSCHGPPADCERSRRTANGKGLYIISP